MERNNIIQKKTKSTILIVDDEPINFQVIEALLEKGKYQLHYVDNGQAAISNLDRVQPDLILLDVMMPGMSGLEVCQQIKALSQWSFVPIIMVTALRSKQDLANCLALGADDFISKPVEKLELRARVQAMLRISHQHQQLECALEQLKSAQTHIIQNEKMSSLGRLVAGIAHEVNNPINFIGGNIEYIEENVNGLIDVIRPYQEKTPEIGYKLYQKLQSLKFQSLDLEFLRQDLPKAFKSVKKGVERIETIVSNLMKFAHLNESGTKDIDIHHSLGNILFLLDNRLNKTGQAIPIQLVKFYGDIPSIHGHPALLNQALMNILSNAIDALDSNLVSDVGQHSSQDIEAQLKQITLKTEAVDNSWVKIAIADNGPGIPLDIQSHIFEPFFTTKSVGDGIGMGLSISYQIITERHGGTLECLSTPNQGTEFIIHLPV